MIPFADDPSLMHEHSTDHGIGRHPACPQPGQFQAAMHIYLVGNRHKPARSKVYHFPFLRCPSGKMPPRSLSRLTLVNFSGVRSPCIRFRSAPVENPSCPRVFPFTHVLVTKTVCMKRFAAILSLAVLMGGC